MLAFIKSPAGRTIIAVTVIAVLLIVVTFTWIVTLSAFAVGIGKGVLGFCLLYVFDRYALKEIDTIEELKKGNIAYALAFLAVALVIAAAILNS